MRCSEGVAAFGFGCPIEDAVAVAFGLVFCVVDDVGEEFFAFGRACSLNASLDDDDVFAIFLGKVDNVGGEFVESLLVGLCRACLMIPIGVDAKSDDVPLGIVFLEDGGQVKCI